jgi:rhodanese-related sulfurtransferase
MNSLIQAAILAFLMTWLVTRLIARARGSSGHSAETKSLITKVSGQDARELKARGVPFVAVFSAREFEASHLPGSLNIPVDQLSSRLSEIEDAKEVVVYCASGMRSARAARILAATGKRVYDLGPMGAF